MKHLNTRKRGKRVRVDFLFEAEACKTVRGRIINTCRVVAMPDSGFHIRYLRAKGYGDIGDPEFFIERIELNDIQELIEEIDGRPCESAQLTIENETDDSESKWFEFNFSDDDPESMVLSNAAESEILKLLENFEAQIRKAQ